MVLDLGLPDMTGFQLITRVKGEIGLRKLPTIVYTGKQLTKREEAELGRLAESVIIKDARSPERLLDETALFLHRVTANLPEGEAADARGSSTGATRRSPAERSSSSTTTSATSSR